MRSWKLLMGACGVLLVAASVAHARIITVRQDGSGDYTTLTAAVAAALPHDAIEVGAGTYAEGAMVDIGIPLSVYSIAGPDATILDGRGTHRILGLRAADITVSGFSLVDGAGTGLCAVTCGGAAIVWRGARAVFEDCSFDRSVGEKGGALYVTDSNMGLGTSATVRKCRFTSGLSATAGSVAYVVLGASATFESCVFDKNTTGVTGAIDVYYSHTDIHDCLFTSNLCNDIAGAVVYYRSSGKIEGNTFVGNTSRGVFAGTVVLQNSPGTIFRRNIVAGETDAYGLLYLDVADPDHGCNVFWENAAGALGGADLAADEVVADPIFCDPAAMDFSVSDNSPAAPEESACGEGIGAFPVGCHLALPGAPVLLGIVDIPNDEGGKVRVRWQGSPYDVRGHSPAITEYGIYRRQNGALSRPPEMLKPREPRVQLDGWDFVAVVPARGDEIYQYVAPTLCDAPIGGPPCWSVFFVSAMTSQPWTYYDSDPDSGYSVDDIPPSAPSNFTVHYAPASGNALAWDAAKEVDVERFRIYRAQDPEFTPGPGFLVQETEETQWVDAQPGRHAYYKITATDRAGNESGPAAAESLGGSPEGLVPAHFDLHPPVPNPFNPQTRIDYDVPAGGGAVQLCIYDANGRLVRTLVDRQVAEGRYSAVWDGKSSSGRSVRSGTYFCSLRAPGFERTLKMTLLQ